MPGAVVPDTTVWIRAIREGRDRAALSRLAPGREIWLTAVSAAELYAGTRSAEDGRAVDAIVGQWRSVGRVLTPTDEEWARAGQLLNRQTRLHGAVRPRDHLADVLIVVSAARLAATVVTANVRHLSVWADLARAGGLDVEIEPFVS